MTMISTDVARMAMALERAGIDPRTWTTLAVVQRVHVDDDGVHCDVTTIAGMDETAALAPVYAGPGFGLYAPIDEGDMVVVAFPEGVPNTGGRIIARVWDRGQPPPSDVTAHPRDFILVTKPDSSLRIVAQGSGDVVVEARDSGKVKLGGDDASRGVARLSDTVGLTQTTAVQLSLALQTALDARYAIANPMAPVSIPAGTPVGAITSASDDVEST